MIPRPVRFAPILASLALLLSFPAARAQVLDPNAWITDGPVNAIARSGNTLYVGGRFTRVGPYTGPFVGFDAGTGVRRTGWPLVKGEVHAIASDGAGGWFVGGIFSSIGGQSRHNLAHVRADGSVAAFDPHPNEAVECMVMRNGTLYVGGWFAVVDGLSREYLAAIDTSTGTPTAWNPGADWGVTGMATDGSSIFVAGRFVNLGGSLRYFGGAVDAVTGTTTGWQPALPDPGDYSLVAAGGNVYAYRGVLIGFDGVTGATLAWDPQPDGEVRSIVGSGTSLYAAGAFTLIGGQSRPGLAELDLSTGLATSWTPMNSAGATAVAVGGGSVYVASSAGVQAVDPATGAVSSWIQRGGNVAGLDVHDGTLAAFGAFAGLGGVLRQRLAAIDLTSGQATAWDPGADDWVRDLAVRGTTVYAAGAFTVAAGLNRRHLAAIDSNTGVATAWDPGADTTVTQILVNGSRVYACGPFSVLGGAARAGLGAVDAVTGVVAPWNPVPSTPVPPPLAPVAAMALHDSRLFVGGTFTEIGGQPRQYVAALDTITASATPWNPGADNFVATLAVHDSSVYVGGYFLILGGQSRGRLGAVSLAGDIQPWDPGADDGVVSVAPIGDRVYAAGRFGHIGGHLRPGVAALDAQTGFDVGWSPGLTAADGQEVLADGTSVFFGSPGFSLPVATQSIDFGGLATYRSTDTAPPSVMVAFPNGGQTLVIGTTASIEWIASDDVGIDSVAVDLSRSGPSGPWTALATAAANTGRLAWTVTGPEVAMGQAFVRVRVKDVAGKSATDLGNEGFEISTNPGGGPSLPAGVVAMAQPYPNPAKARAFVPFSLPAPGHVRIALCDVQGREVVLMADNDFESGPHEVAFDAGAIPSGMYFVRLKSEGVERTKRVVVIR